MCVCGILCVNYLVCHDPWEQLRGFHLLSGWVPGYLPGRSVCITPELHLPITGGLLKLALPAPCPQFILPPTVVAGPHLHSTLTAPSFRAKLCFLVYRSPHYPVLDASPVVTLSPPLAPLLYLCDLLLLGKPSSCCFTCLSSCLLRRSW